MEKVHSPPLEVVWRVSVSLFRFKIYNRLRPAGRFPPPLLPPNFSAGMKGEESFHAIKQKHYIATHIYAFSCISMHFVHIYAHLCLLCISIYFHAYLCISCISMYFHAYLCISCISMYYQTYICSMHFHVNRAYLCTFMSLVHIYILFMHIYLTLEHIRYVHSHRLLIR